MLWFCMLIGCAGQYRSERAYKTWCTRAISLFSLDCLSVEVAFVELYESDRPLIFSFARVYSLSASSLIATSRLTSGQ